ncbi:hypothetical protein EJ04DRAFT_573344 [Polyplosphaeria fusca]|uniref:Uncharacterized protein n=1 Tax=Polyplosphaeria fusca TaxID=682080 RepID=A0A9P4V3V1_9PLEO|nr:hypothetical protein EJ04DRAFT_573344 [Polyplosphaeria fusca]
MASPYPPISPTLSRSTARTLRIGRVLLRWIWAIQAMIAIPHVLVLFWIMLLALLLPGIGVVVSLLVLPDFVAAASIVVVVVTQYVKLCRGTSVAFTFKAEMAKAVAAAFVWLWTWVPFLGGVSDELRKDQMDKDMLRKVMIVRVVWTILIVLLFFAPLWYAYEEWRVREERAGPEEGDIELADSREEGRIRLLERTSIDSLDSLANK